MSEHSSLRANFEKLTPKQRRVLRLLSENRTSKEIAQEIGVSPSCVDLHLRGVRNRFGPLSRGELSRLYRQLECASGEPAAANLAGAVMAANICLGKVNQGHDLVRSPTPASRPTNAHCHCICSTRFIPGLLVGFLIGAAIANALVAVMKLSV